MPQLKLSRFEALAGYIRDPRMLFLIRELDWWSDPAERVLGVLTEELGDQDYGGVILGRDAHQRFRAISLFHSYKSKSEALDKLKAEIEVWAHKPDSAYYQGDEKGQVIDIFSPKVPAGKLHQSFSTITSQREYSPAYSLMKAMMPYFTDVDGNFVEQFQTVAFDARFWELYLFALLTEQEFAFDRSFNAPDYCCESIHGKLFVEAVTVNPKRDASGAIVEPEVPTDRDKFLEYYHEYMPIKWGSALTSKLQKKYWELPHVSDGPFVLAIQDFHVAKAMSRFPSSIISYLYGVDESHYFDAEGNLKIVHKQREAHKWGEKVIESGFFNLPESENISAVMTNATATISKFNRIGYASGFGDRGLKMIYIGQCHKHDPNATMPENFSFDVSDPSYQETWTEGLSVFHNPKARHPLPESYFAGAAHHRHTSKGFVSWIPEFHPYGGETIIRAL